MTKKKGLTKKELKQLTPVLEKLEADYMFGYEKVNGAFASADVFDYDDDIIDVEMKFGIQDGDENTVYTEQLEIDRKTFEVID